jgi:hypothetical protein
MFREGNDLTQDAFNVNVGGGIATCTILQALELFGKDGPK